MKRNFYTAIVVVSLFISVAFAQAKDPVLIIHPQGFDEFLPVVNVRFDESVDLVRMKKKLETKGNMTIDVRQPALNSLAILLGGQDETLTLEKAKALINGVLLPKIGTLDLHSVVLVPVMKPLVDGNDKWVANYSILCMYTYYEANESQLRGVDRVLEKHGAQLIGEINVLGLHKSVKLNFDHTWHDIYVIAHQAQPDKKTAIKFAISLGRALEAKALEKSDYCMFRCTLTAKPKEQPRKRTFSSYSNENSNKDVGDIDLREVYGDVPEKECKWKHWDGQLGGGCDCHN